MASPEGHPLDSLVERWLSWDQDEGTRSEIENLVASGDEEELGRRLRSRIQFGTAGLRGRMQAGFAFMNCLTVIQASQGIAALMATNTGASSSILIGHDTRHNSARYASLTANAFRSKGIRVMIYEVIRLARNSTWGLLMHTQMIGLRAHAFGGLWGAPLPHRRWNHDHSVSQSCSRQWV